MMSISSISSVSTPPPIQPIQAPPTNQSKGPETGRMTATAMTSSAAQPPARAPLPPGQGTRIDQMA